MLSATLWMTLLADGCEPDIVGNAVMNESLDVLDSGLVEGGEIYRCLNHLPAEAPGNEVARLLCARVVSDGKVTQSVDIRHEVSVEIEYEVRANTINTFGGGTNEIQRELIAQFGLQMPKPVR